MTQFSSRVHEKYEPGHRDGDGCVFPEPGHFAPRPTNPTNPILAEIRTDEHYDGKPVNYWLEVQLLRFQRQDEQAYQHAHRVLTRLAQMGDRRGQ